MIYIEYEELKQKYYEAQKKYDELLQEKEDLFAMTQPNSLSYDKEKVSGGKNDSPFDKYLIRKEQTKIEERLAEARINLADRKVLTNLKQEELEKSEHLHDKVYVRRYIEREKIKRIARELMYSEPHIKRILKQINTRLQKVRRDGEENSNDGE